MQVLFNKLCNLFNDNQKGVDFSSKLPQELLLRILQECDFKSIKNLNQSNKLLNKITEENNLTGDCLKYSTLIKIIKVARKDISSQVYCYTKRYIDKKQGVECFANDYDPSEGKTITQWIDKTMIRSLSKLVTHCV